MSKNTENTIVVEESSACLDKFNRIIQKGLGRAAEPGDFTVVTAADFAALKTKPEVNEVSKPVRKFR